MITASRYHDISCGHRVVGHESKCRFLHGHNYRVHFTCRADGQAQEFVQNQLSFEDVSPEAGTLVMAETDKIGRVVDFSVIKHRLCDWLENQWDHKFLFWRNDPMLDLMLSSQQNWLSVSGTPITHQAAKDILDSICVVPFNPTAENMAKYLLDYVGPQVMTRSGAVLCHVRIEETRKCSVEVC